MSIRLPECVALVTGASRGIGRACALALAEAGAHVAVNYLTSALAAEEVGLAINALGVDAALIKADVSEEHDVQAMIEFVKTRFGRLDIVVSNAATGGFRPLAEATDAHFQATMNTNVRPLLALVRHALPLLKLSPIGGRVIAISSRGAHVALPNYGLIGSSKAALESLMRHYALELGPVGIHFNTVEAGLIATDSLRQLPNFQALEEASQKRALLPAPALNARHVADTVVFLASPYSRMIQGQTLVVDAGASIHTQ